LIILPSRHRFTFLVVSRAIELMLSMQFVFVRLTASRPPASRSTLVLTVEELPPPMELSVDLASTGTVNGRGVATLHGTLTCSRAGSIDLTVGLRQGTSIGFAGTTVDCDGTERWRIQVIGETGGFRPGRAFGLAVASFQDPARGEVVTARDDGTVQLRR
jgi:hypothetical protein